MKKLIIIVLILLVCATVGGVLLILKNPGGMFDSYPEIILPETDCKTQTVAIEFPFESSTVKGSVELELAPYYGAQNAEKSAHLYGESAKNNDWMKNYYLAVTNDPALFDVYSKLTGFFQNYAAAHNLDDDEYIEMVTAYVQNIPYKTIGVNTKFPVETVIDNWGDCDDKSTLLAGLLSCAGFDTALLSYPDHMTCAVKTDRGVYVPVETTAVMFIGDTSGSNASGGIDLTSPLDMYKIGEGTKVYGSYDEVEKILQAEKKLTAKMESIETELDNLDKLMDEQKRKIDAGDRELVLAYNKNVNVYNGYVEEYNAAGKLIKRIYSEGYNRKGVYEAVKSV